MAKKPTLRVREEIETAWALSGANKPVTNEDSEAAREELTDFHFMDTSELEQIVGLGQKGTHEYETAQRVLLERPAEFQRGHGAQRYRGIGTPSA